MSEIVDVLAESHVFGSLTGTELAVVARCASEVDFTEGEALFRVGGEANALYLVTSGQVDLLVQPATGEPIPIETIGEADVVGVSWMAPPYEWTLDAVAAVPTKAIRISARCLNQACESDLSLGVSLHRQFARLVRRRLVGTRLRLLDVYGDAKSTP